MSPSHRVIFLFIILQNAPLAQQEQQQQQTKEKSEKRRNDDNKLLTSAGMWRMRH